MPAPEPPKKLRGSLALDPRFAAADRASANDSAIDEGVEDPGSIDEDDALSLSSIPRAEYAKDDIFYTHPHNKEDLGGPITLFTASLIDSLAVCIITVTEVTPLRVPSLFVPFGPPPPLRVVLVSKIKAYVCD